MEPESCWEKPSFEDAKCVHFPGVEINEGYVGASRVWYSKGASLHLLHLTETQRQAQEKENFLVGKKEKTSCTSRLEASGRGRYGWVTRSRASYVIG